VIATAVFENEVTGIYDTIFPILHEKMAEGNIGRGSLAASAMGKYCLKVKD
jgi:hypothetical protein